MATIAQERAERLAYLRQLRSRFRDAGRFAVKGQQQADRVVVKATGRSATYLPDLNDVLRLADTVADLTSSVEQLERTLEQAESVWEFN